MTELCRDIISWFHFRNLDNWSYSVFSFHRFNLDIIFFYFDVLCTPLPYLSTQKAWFGQDDLFFSCFSVIRNVTDDDAGYQIWNYPSLVNTPTQSARDDCTLEFRRPLPPSTLPTFLLPSLFIAVSASVEPPNIQTILGVKNIVGRPTTGFTPKMTHAAIERRSAYRVGCKSSHSISVSRIKDDSNPSSVNAQRSVSCIL